MLLISPSVELAIGNTAFESTKEEYEGKILSPSHYYVKMVHKIIANLVNHSNVPDLKQLHWEVIVVESEELNAMVSPGGKVTVYTGIFKAAFDEELLAAVLAHEIGHVLARHTAEALSNAVVQQGAGFVLK